MPVQLLGQPEPLGKVVGIGHVPELGRQQRVPPDLLPLFAGQRRAQPLLQLLQLVEYPVEFLPLRRRPGQGVVLPEKDLPQLVGHLHHLTFILSVFKIKVNIFYSDTLNCPGGG